MITLLPNFFFNEKLNKAFFRRLLSEMGSSWQRIVGWAVKQDPIDLVMALYLDFSQKELNEDEKSM